MAKDGKVILACSECLSRNYTTNRRKNTAKRLELNKYCPKCGRKLPSPDADCINCSSKGHIFSKLSKTFSSLSKICK